MDGETRLTAESNGKHNGAVPALALSVGAADLQAHFATLIDSATGPIGRVVGSEKEPAGAHQFCIWAADEAVSLDVGHIVVAFSEEAAVIGVVDEPRRFSDLRTFLDDYFDRHVEMALDEELATRRPEILVFTVNVLATRHLRADVDSHRPVVSGPVFFATPEAIELALGRDEFSGVPIPALLHSNGNAARTLDGSEQRNANGEIVFQRAPIWVDGDYLLGPEAGHANWTGQSGLATKTSHALFLTSAIFQKLQAEGQTVAALMFNVKGPDLLWLDKPADPAPGLEAAYEAAGAKSLRDEDHQAYAALELEPKPFIKFRLFAPFKPGQDPHSERQAIQLESVRYHSALNTLRNASNETHDVYPILWSLRPLLGMPHKVFERSDLDDKMWGLIAEIRDQQNIDSLDQLNNLFDDIEAHFAGDPRPDDWRGHHQFTVRKARNRFNGLRAKFGGLLSSSMVEYGKLPRVEESFSDQELRVVDIANCNTNVQELIVSSTIYEIWRKAEQQQLGVDKLIVFVDELNKYAPGGGQGALRDTLVDIAARGRHLNVVLFGAQQFRSKVEDEVLGNCGTALYGRVGDEEIVNSAYRSLSETARAELLGLPKGRLLIRHAHFRSPLFGTFPYPPTIPGMAGQRVFNGEAGTGAERGHPGDGIFQFLQRQMGNRAPRLADVRRATDGYDAEVLNDICFRVEAEYRRIGGVTNRTDPWKKIQFLLRQRGVVKH